MSNLQEDVGGSPPYSASHSLIDMIPEVGKAGSRMDIRNLLSQLLPRLNKLQSTDGRFDAKISNPADLLNQLEPSVLSPLLEVMKCFQQENSGHEVPVPGGGGSSSNGGGGWNNLDLSCDTNHWRDGPIDIKPTDEPLVSLQANVPQPFKAPSHYDLDRGRKPVMNSENSFCSPLSPDAIKERVMRARFQGQSFPPETGLVNGTRNHNTLPQMSPPMDLTSSTLNGLGSVSTAYTSQENASQLDQSGKTYHELSSNPPYPRDLQLKMHNQEQNSDHTNTAVQGSMKHSKQ